MAVLRAMEGGYLGAHLSAPSSPAGARADELLRDAAEERAVHGVLARRAHHDELVHSLADATARDHRV